MRDEQEAVTVTRRRPAWLRIGPVRLTLALMLVAGGLWYLESGHDVPFAGNVKHQSPAGLDGVDFGIDSGAESGPAPRVGESAPGFTLQDLEGKAVNLGDFRGQIVVLNFWASWCGPCRADLPVLQSTYERLRDRGVVVVGVNVEESVTTARRFAQDLGVNYPLVLDRDGSVMQRYRVGGLPLTFIVGPDGVITGQIIGQLDTNILARHLTEALLAGNDLAR